jgi:hypothetical protein
MGLQPADGHKTERTEGRPVAAGDENASAFSARSGQVFSRV